MNSLTFLILVIFSMMLFVNFRKTFTFILVSSIWLTHFQTGLSGGLSFYAIISGVAFFVFIIKESGTINVRTIPLKIPFFLIIISYLLTNYLIGPVHTPSTILVFLPPMLDIIMFWNLVRRYPRQMTRSFVMYSLYFGLFIGAYNIFEAVFKTNPIVSAFLQMGAYVEDGPIIDEIRFGIKRTQSIFLMHTSNGCASTLLFITLAYAFLKTEILGKYRFIAITAIVLLACSVFFCGARSCILGLVICSLCLFDKKYLSRKYIVPIIVIGFIFLVAASGYLFSVYESIVNSDKAGLGSSESMRQGQFEMALYFLLMSPIFGNGINYTWSYVVKNYHDIMLGAESMWFSVMIDRGLLGVSALAIYWFYTFSLSYKQNKYNVFFVLGIFIMNSMSSLPCFEPTFVILYVIIMGTLITLQKGPCMQTKVKQKSLL